MLSKRNEHVLVLGPAAIGKTEFARAYLHQYAQQYSSAAYVRFSRIWGNDTLYPSIAHELGILPPGSDIGQSRMVLAQHLSKERSLVILDGLDEAPPQRWPAPIAGVSELLHMSTMSRLLLTSRTDDADAGNCTVFRLKGLNQSEAADLASRFLPSRGLGQEILAQLYARTDGNPLVLRLLFDHLSRATFRAEEVPRLMELLFAQQWGREISNLVIGITPEGLRTFAALQDSSVGVLTPTSEMVLAAPYVYAQSHSQFWRRDIDRFDELLNDSKATEHHFQEFFEQHSGLLTGIDYSRAVPHPVLARDQDGPLIPDFFLQPLDGQFCDILDLKLPTEKLIVGSKDRLRPSSSLSEAIAQLREYGAYFEDPHHRATIQQKYGLTAYRPQLFVVIGRSPALVPPEQYRRVMSDNSQVRVMTYDDLRRRLERLIAMSPFRRH